MTELLWEKLTVEELNECAQQDAIVLLPVGSVEQHGPHLPSGVDAFLCTEACCRTARLISQEQAVIVAPTIWHGLAEHHVRLGGTITLSLRTWHSLLEDVIGSIHRAGFRRVCVVNGHGGNMAALSALTTDITRSLQLPVATTSYWNLPQSSGAFADILETQHGVQHACEAETSMMLASYPDLVRTDKIPQSVGSQMSMLEAIGADLMIWNSFENIAPTGVLGDAGKATKDKGERLLDTAATHLATAILRGEPWNKLPEQRKPHDGY